MSARTLDIELLKTFHMASSLGTLRATAERRHCTLGAVSQQIKRLEQQLNRQLLTRFQTGVQLTPEGEQLLAQSLSLIGEHDALLARLSSQPPEGIVRLGLPNEYVPQVLDNVLPVLRETLPRVNLRVHTANSGALRRAVTQGELELAIVVEPEADRAATDIPLWRTQPVWAGSVHSALRVDDPVPLALHPHDCTYRALGMEALSHSGRAWETVFASSSVIAIESAVSNGLAVSVLNRARLTSQMREYGLPQGLPPLPKCFAYLIESGNIPAQDTAAAAIVKERLQTPYLTRQIKQAG